MLSELINECISLELENRENTGITYFYMYF